ncbi:MAG: hypothetical protein ACLT94_10320 [Lachnospira eligens]
MIRKYMIVGLTVLSFAAVTACGAKKDTAAGNIEQSTESATVAKAKDIQMQVKDADGNTVTLTGDATINEAGEMVFEGKDSAGNVVKVTGTAEKTDGGGFKVKEAAVEGTAKVVADNGQETEVSNEGSGDITADEIKNTTTEVVKNDSGDKQETNNAGQNESASNVPDTKPSGESNSANTGETSAPDNGNNSNTSDTTPATPTVPEHTHTWSPVTTTIHHDATGHYEDVVVGTKTVVDKAAWNEPVYEYRAYAVKCLGCGKEFENGLDYQEHSMNRIDEGYDECGRSTVLYRNEQVDTIHHEEETHEETITEKRWVEDTAAYEEKVTSYICSCGATK